MGKHVAQLLQFQISKAVSINPGHFGQEEFLSFARALQESKDESLAGLRIGVTQPQGFRRVVSLHDPVILCEVRQVHSPRLYHVLHCLPENFVARLGIHAVKAPFLRKICASFCPPVDWKGTGPHDRRDYTRIAQMPS